MAQTSDCWVIHPSVDIKTSQISAAIRARLVEKALGIAHYVIRVDKPFCGVFHGVGWKRTIDTDGVFAGVCIKLPES